MPPHTPPFAATERLQAGSDNATPSSESRTQAATVTTLLAASASRTMVSVRNGEGRNWRRPEDKACGQGPEEEGTPSEPIQEGLVDEASVDQGNGWYQLASVD